MKKILFSLIAAVSLLSADGSHIIDINWKAFKTFRKLGVSGQFMGLKFIPKTTTKVESFEELMLGAKIYIDKTKVDTRNRARDKTLVTMFFNKLKGGTIDGEIVNLKSTNRKEGFVDIRITMNDKSLIIPMEYKYSFKDGEFRAKSVIDILDFDGGDALKSINNACYDLHNGKTWSDVEIEFVIKIKGYFKPKGIKGLFG